MKNVLLTIEYDGSNFHGWQLQPSLRTVQGELEAVLSDLFRQPVRIHGASRTDAGVHAFGQTATFSGDFAIPTERIPIAVNNRLTDIQIRSAQDVPAGFHARYDAQGKTYFYGIRLSRDRDIFVRNHRYLLNDALNTVKMIEASKSFIGVHDFAAFQATGGVVRETTVRTIYDLTVEEAKVRDSRGEITREVWLRVTGDGFLYNMVRIIAGTLVEIGLGRRHPEDIGNVIISGDRRNAGPTAPPGGLFLEQVWYNNLGKAESNE